VATTAARTAAGLAGRHLLLMCAAFEVMPATWTGCPQRATEAHERSCLGQ
jgi:hypothetical protein